MMVEAGVLVAAEAVAAVPTVTIAAVADRTASCRTLVLPSLFLTSIPGRSLRSRRAEHVGRRTKPLRVWRHPRPRTHGRAPGGAGGPDPITSGFLRKSPKDLRRGRRAG